MGTSPLSLPTIEAHTPDASVVLLHDTQARFILGVIVIAQFVILVGYVVWAGRQLPDSQLILGAEIGFVSIVLQFFFGSSSGSVTKSASKGAGTTTETTSSP